MISFFKTTKGTMIALKSKGEIDFEDLPKLEWLLAGKKSNEQSINGAFVGPRKEMVSPWSTNAVEITQNMGISNIIRMEEYQIKTSANDSFDPMLEQKVSVASPPLPGPLPEPCRHRPPGGSFAPC